MTELTGIERSKLSKFRSGDRKNPTYDDGAEIMKIYNAQVKSKAEVNSHRRKWLRGERL